MAVGDADAGGLLRQQRRRSHARERVRFNRKEFAVFRDADVRAAVTRATQSVVGVLHEFLNACGEFRCKFCRSDFLAFAVVLRFKVEVFAGRHAHFGRRQGLFAFDVTAARFAAGNELFAEQTVRVLEQILSNLAGFVEIFSDADADGRTSQRILDDERETEFVRDAHERIASEIVLPNDAVRWRRDVVCAVDFLRLDFVHREC